MEDRSHASLESGDCASVILIEICCWQTQKRGGYKDVWLDREGHDLAIRLKDRGITSLVLKYRTNALDENGNRRFPMEVYFPAVLSDAKQAIRILRSQSESLHIDQDKIGIAGYSAGGHLAAFIALLNDENNSETIDWKPNFAGLFYPGIPKDYREKIQNQDVPPIFIINARVDNKTPADQSLDFYSALLKAGIQSELHIYSKGGHGFDLGYSRGESVSIWSESFIAWLKDIDIINR